MNITPNRSISNDFDNQKQGDKGDGIKNSSEIVRASTVGIAAIGLKAGSSTVVNIKREMIPRHVEGKGINEWADKVMENFLKRGWPSTAEKKEALKAMLVKTNLMSIDNLAKFKKYYDEDGDFTDQGSLILSILMGYLENPLKPTIDQNSFQKLTALVDLIEPRELENLTYLGAAGLINEKSLELYAVNPKAFKINEVDFSDATLNGSLTHEGYNQIKKFYEAVLEKLSEIGETSTVESTPIELEAGSSTALKIEKEMIPRYVEGKGINEWADKVIEVVSKARNSYSSPAVRPKEALKATLVKTHLMNIDNLTKLKIFFEPDGDISDKGELIASILMNSLESPLKPTIDQASFEKLIALVDFIEPKERGNLALLGVAGLINEDNLELYAANPEAFNIIEEDFEGAYVDGAFTTEGSNQLKEFFEDALEKLR